MPGLPIQPTDPKFLPIVIFLTGNSGIGKSTLANVLASTTVHHVILDHYIISLPSWSKSEKCINIHKKYSNVSYQIDLISKEIDDTCADEFANEIIDRECPNDKPVILVEGYTASLPRIRESMINKFKNRKYVIWSLNRVH